MKSLRLITTLECNLSCPYCCNDLPEVKHSFARKQINEIDFTRYNAICITGGEPLLDDAYRKVYDRIPAHIPKYLYTNGLLLKKHHLWLFDGINIGIHYKHQAREILSKMPDIIANSNIKFYVQDTCLDYLVNIPENMIKTWTMNECFYSQDNEEWIILI